MPDTEHAPKISEKSSVEDEGLLRQATDQAQHLGERASQYAGDMGAVVKYTTVAVAAGLEERCNEALDALVDALDEETRLKAIHHQTNPNHPDLVNARAARSQARKEYIAIADRTTHVRLESGFRLPKSTSASY